MKVVLLCVVKPPFFGEPVKVLVGFVNAFLVVLFFERIPLTLLLLTNAAGYHIKGEVYVLSPRARNVTVLLF